MAGRLDYHTRRRLRRAVSDQRRLRARNAGRIDKELEREMTITSTLTCADCQHPFRQHAFGGGCTLNPCDCQQFAVADAKNGNGHQADAEPHTASPSSPVEKPEAEKPARPVARPKSTTCKRCDRPVRPNSPVKGLYALLCEQHYQQRRLEQSQDALARNAAKRGEPAPPPEPKPEPEPRAALQPAAPPPTVVEAAPTIQVTSLEVQQGQWQLYRGPEGECRLGFATQGAIRIPWSALEGLPALIGAVGQAFGAARE